MAAIILFILLLAGSQTTMATEKWKVNLSAKINGPSADQVWPYVQDFCNLYKIYPNSVSFCQKVTPTRPGLARYSVTIGQTPSNATTVVGWVREKVTEVSAAKKFIGYEVHENTYGIITLKASMQVVGEGKNGSTLKWNIVATPINGLTYETFAGPFGVVLQGIVALIEGLF